MTSYFVKPVDAFVTMSQKVENDIKTLNILKPVKQIVHPLYDSFGEPVLLSEARKYLNIFSCLFSRK